MSWSDVRARSGAMGALLILCVASAAGACTGASSGSSATASAPSAATDAPSTTAAALPTPSAIATEPPTASPALDPTGQPSATPTPKATSTPKATLPTGDPGCAGGSTAPIKTSGAAVPSIAPGHFAPAAPLPTGGGHDTATLLANGKVLLLGAGRPMLYEAATNTFSPAGAMVQERAFPLAIPLASGKVIVLGGTGFGTCAISDIDSMEIYDPATNRFTPVNWPAPNETYRRATPLADGTILLTEGSVYVNDEWVPASAVFDPSTGKLTRVGGDLQPGGGAAVATLPDHSVLFAGGYKMQGMVWQPISTAMRYVPATHRFEAVAMPTTAPRGGATATLLKDGRVLVAGGVTSISDDVCPGACLRSSELYDPATGGFVASGSMVQGRANHTATLLPSGDVLVTGGAFDEFAEIWSSGTFHPTAGPMTHPRGETVSVLLPDGRVLVVGEGTADLYQP